MNREMKKYAAAVLALHGFTGCGNDFDCVRHFFPDTFFDSPDLHGKDVRKDFPSLLDMLSERFERLSGNLPRVLLGYSMGGRIALHLALKLSRENALRKGDRLVLISASPGIADEAERRERQKSDTLLAEKIINAASAESFYAYWKTLPIIASQADIPEPWRTRILESRAIADKTNWANSLAIVGTGTLPPLWDELAEITCETFLVCGENDAKFSQIAERMSERMPDSRVIKIPHCGHAPHLENPQDFKKQFDFSA